MEQRTPGLRWGVEQRLEFIEFRLFWEGGVNRSDITRYFGVSVPQASKDLSHYQALAPDNIHYDRSQKRYFATKEFKPRFLNPDADRYLSYLRSIADGVLAQHDTWLCEPPAFEGVPSPRRNVEPDIVRAVLHAVRSKKALEIRYQSLSLNRPEPMWRWITPHALAHDGYRWHVRAFCHIDREFKDFLLPRILKTRDEAEPGAKSEDDLNWQDTTIIAIKPHPGLTEHQKQVVARDYGMRAERLDVRVRYAFVYYLLKRLNLDFEEEKRPAREQHVVLANPSEAREALARAMGEKLFAATHGRLKAGGQRH
jgi:predicted DNA-binding transcriptional regulator YafY